MLTEKEKELALQDLYKKYNSCENCPLFKNRKSTIKPIININAKYVFLVDFIYDADTNFSNKKEVELEYLYSLLDLFGIKKEEVSILPLVLCPSYRSPKKKEISACRPRLHAELNILDPRFIISLGADALKGLYSSYPPSYMSSSGRMVNLDVSGYITSFNLGVFVTQGLNNLIRFNNNLEGSPMWNFYKDMQAVDTLNTIMDKIDENK